MGWPTELGTTKTARELYEAFGQSNTRPRIGFGERCCLINIDFQIAYLPLAPYADPRQIDHANLLSGLCRARGVPVIWMQNLHGADAEDYGIRGLRKPGIAAAGGLIAGSPGGAIDPRCDVRRDTDFVISKRMPSSFFETHLSSLLTIRRIDTIIVTGGSTSGCLRATVVDGFSGGYRMIVPEEATSGQDESAHFAGLRDMAEKYADVIPLAEVEAHLHALPASKTLLSETVHAA